MKKEIVSGHLQVKSGKYYVVLYLPQPNGKKKAKWISTHLEERGNKTRAEEILRELRRRVLFPRSSKCVENMQMENPYCKRNR